MPNLQNGAKNKDFWREKGEKEGFCMRREHKKGMTIAEICIVLSVLSVVSLSIVSFAAMATGRGATSTDKLKVMQDIELLEAMVDNWFNEVYKPGDATVEKSKLLINGRELSWVNGNLIIDGTRTYPFEMITELTFEKMSQGDDDIYFCKVTYTYRQNKDKIGYYTFCVNPRVGESIKQQ